MKLGLIHLLKKKKKKKNVGTNTEKKKSFTHLTFHLFNINFHT